MPASAFSRAISASRASWVVSSGMRIVSERMPAFSQAMPLLRT